MTDTYIFRQTLKKSLINCIKVTYKSNDEIKVMVGYENKKFKEINMKINN